MVEPVHYLSPTTTWVVGIFIVIYMFAVLRRAIANKFDLFDFLMLSAIAIILGIFVLFPSFFIFLSQVLGIMFPFLLLFGALILIIFLIMYNLIRRIHGLEEKTRILTQEISFLEEKQRRES